MEKTKEKEEKPSREYDPAMDGYDFRPAEQKTPTGFPSKEERPDLYPPEEKK